MSPSVLAHTDAGLRRAEALPRRVHAIVHAVAEDHGVNLYDLLSDSKRPALAYARFAAYVAVSQMPYGRGNPTFAQVGRWFGRDHSPVSRAVRKVLGAAWQPRSPRPAILERSA